MCGLTGIFHLQGAETNNKVIKEMLRLQRHRGPDDQGFFGINLQKKVFEEVKDGKRQQIFQSPMPLLFGFNRLSIQDTSANGHQPMIGRTGKVVLMMNGEIYNAGEYRSQLRRKGYHFKSSSDTEVALYLFEEFGINGMLDRLNGMFAFAIADLKRKKLYLVRDRFGIKPLYFLKENDRYAFSSEIKSFKALENFQFELNESLIDEFLLFRNVINRTLFKNITNIAPGTYIEIDSKGNINEIEYYSVRNEGDKLIDSRSSENALEKALTDSVQRQMVSDVKLGCQLSGGVDSSLVTHFSNKALEKGKLETVSIVFDDSRYTEKKFIDYVAKQLQLTSHQFTLNSDYYINSIENATWHFEQPLNHPNTIGIYLLSQRAKEHVTVLLSGEGADESLAGYSRFTEMFNNPYLSKKFLSTLYHNKNDLFSFKKWYMDAEYRVIMSTAYGSTSNAKKIFGDFNLDRALKNRKKIINSISDSDPSKQRKYEMLTYLPDLLMRQDKMSMAHSIENRVPFLDNEMIEKAFQIKESILVEKYNRKWEGKKPLKDIAANYFSEDFAYRSKMGFGIPLRSFFQESNFEENLRERIIPGIKKRRIFDHNVVQKWVNDISKLNNQELDSLWLMYGFEIWAQQYLDV